MKYFSKLLSMPLVGVVLVSTACTDYADDIANTNAQLGEVQADVEGILELLDKIECEHGDALDAIIAGHCDDLAGLAEDIADANDEILALKGVDADLKKSIEFINSLLKELAGEQDEEKLLSAMATWNALFDGLKVFYETQLEGLLSDVEAAKAFMKSMNETLTAYKATYSQKAGMSAVVEDLETVIAKFQALEKEFAQYKEDTAVEFSKVYAAIASLGSVQSIVYVPEYSDGCATINVAYINNMIVEARSTMEFMVTPASGAGKIVSMWTENPEVLAIVHEDLKERLNTRSAEHLFNVANVYVKNGEPDRLMVEFDTRHLDPAFYAREKSYALSLVYNAGNEGDVTSEANVASCFVKAVATTKPEILKIDIANASGNFITNTLAEHHKIQYTNDPASDQNGNVALEVPVSLLNMHKIAFYAEGFEREYRTFEEMIAQGYDLNLVNNVNPEMAAGYKKDFSDCLNTDGNVNPAKDEPLKLVLPPYNPDKGNHNYYKTQISDEVNSKGVEYTKTQDYIGFVGTYKYNYIVESNYYDYQDATNESLNDLTEPDFYAESDVTIVEKTVYITVPVEDVVWTYSKDVAADAYLYDNNNPEAHYTRSFVLELPEYRGEPTDEMPVDVNYHYFLEHPTKYLEDVKFIYNRDPEYVTKGATASLVHKPHTGGIEDKCKYELTINDFEWDKNYDIEFFYDAPGVHLYLTFEVKTIDRDRSVVDVKYEDFAELVYHSNLKFEFNGNTDVLDKTFVELKDGQEIHYDVELADWMADTFDKHAYEINSNKANATERANTKLVFDITKGKSYEFNVLYDYTDETGVVKHDLDYVTTFTTWYGQKFTLNKTITFQSPDYAFVGVEKFYIGTDGDKKYAQAQPRWFPNEQGVPFDKNLPLEQFAIERVNMWGAFDLEKSHGENINLPSSYEHGDCAILEAETYTAKYELVDNVKSYVDNKAGNKELDNNFHEYSAGIVKMAEDVLYHEVGNPEIWHYKYTDTLAPEFFVDEEKGAYDEQHIKFNTGMGKNYSYVYALAYYGSTPEVKIGAKLYVVNDNNSKFEVEGTNFNSDKKNTVNENYTNFYTRMHYPFKDLVPGDETKIELGSAAKDYFFTATTAMSLLDKRDVELLNNKVKDFSKAQENFVIGDGQNGFADGYSAAKVYGYPTLDPACYHVIGAPATEDDELDLEFSYVPVGVIDNNILDAIEFNEETGVLKFKYKPEMRLLEPISFEITAKLVSSWTCKPVVKNGEVTYEILDEVDDIQDGVKRPVKATVKVTFGHDLQ